MPGTGPVKYVPVKRKKQIDFNLLNASLQPACADFKARLIDQMVRFSLYGLSVQSV